MTSNRSCNRRALFNEQARVRLRIAGAVMENTEMMPWAPRVGSS